MALPKIGDGEQTGDGNTNETLNVGRSGQTVQIAGSAASLWSSHGASPTDQYAFVADVSTSATTQTSPFGFVGSTQAAALIAAVNSILAALREKGIMAAS